MTENFNKQHLFKVFTVICLICAPLTKALPSPISDDEMVHNNNYDMIIPDDHEPAESMHYQNFDGFFNAETMENDAMAEMEMDENRISRVIRAPQPLNARERYLREQLEELDVQREKRVQRSLVKGATRPRSDANDWEKFDYDMWLNNNH